MPREIPPTDAPLSAVGSAAQRVHTDEYHSSAFIQSEEADRVRPRIRRVIGGAPVIEPIVEDDDYRVTVRASDPDGEVLAKDWAEDWPEDPLDSLEARPEARMDGGSSKAPFLAVVENGGGGSEAQTATTTTKTPAPHPPT